MSNLARRGARATGTPAMTATRLKRAQLATAITARTPSLTVSTRLTPSSIQTLLERRSSSRCLTQELESRRRIKWSYSSYLVAFRIPDRWTPKVSAWDLWSPKILSKHLMEGSEWSQSTEGEPSLHSVSSLVRMMTLWTTCRMTLCCSNLPTEASTLVRRAQGQLCRCQWSLP